jgi:antitoxin YefM
MVKQTTYSDARKRFAELWDQAEDTREAVVMTRRGHEDMALLPVAELRSLRATAELLRSPRNAARLLAALESSRRGEAAAAEYGSIDELATELGLG